MFCVLVHTCSLQKTAIIAHTNGGITHSIVVKLISHGPHSACVIFRRRRRLTKGEMLSLICACSSVCVRIFLKRKMARRRRQNKRPRILHARAKWRQSVRITHTHTHWRRGAQKNGKVRRCGKTQGARWAHLFYSTHLALGGVCSLPIYVCNVCPTWVSEWAQVFHKGGSQRAAHVERNLKSLVIIIFIRRGGRLFLSRALNSLIQFDF
jgi:hypothetical protein